MPVDLEELERLARGATPGPWYRRRNYLSTHSGFRQHAPEDEFRIGHLSHVTDCSYVAAASPDVVLALVARLRAAEEERDGALARSREYADGWDAHSARALDAESRATRAEERASELEELRDGWKQRAEAEIDLRKRAEAERDRARRRASAAADDGTMCLRLATEERLRVQAQRDRLAEALREVLRLCLPRDGVTGVINVVRAALAEVKNT